MRKSLVLLTSLAVVSSGYAMDGKKVVAKKTEVTNKEQLPCLLKDFKSYPMDLQWKTLAGSLPKKGKELSGEQRDEVVKMLGSDEYKLEKTTKAFFAAKVLTESGNLTSYEDSKYKKTRSVVAKIAKDTCFTDEVDKYMVDACKMVDVYDPKTPMYKQYGDFANTMKTYEGDFNVQVAQSEKEQQALTKEVSTLKSNIEKHMSSLVILLESFKAKAPELQKAKNNVMRLRLAQFGAASDAKTSYEALKDQHLELSKEVSDQQKKVDEYKQKLKAAKEDEKETIEKQIREVKIQRDLKEAEAQLEKIRKQKGDCQKMIDTLEGRWTKVWSLFGSYN